MTPQVHRSILLVWVSIRSYVLLVAFLPMLSVWLSSKLDYGFLMYILTIHVVRVKKTIAFVKCYSNV